MTGGNVRGERQIGALVKKWGARRQGRLEKIVGARKVVIILCREGNYGEEHMMIIGEENATFFIFYVNESFCRDTVGCGKKGIKKNKIIFNDFYNKNY